MRAIRILTLRRLRNQPLRAVIAAVTVAAGVALASAILVVTSSITTSARQFARSLAGPAPLRVVGPTGRGDLSPATVLQIATTRGVGSAVPIIKAVTRTGPRNDPNRTVLALGVDCSVQALVGAFGCTPDLLTAAGDRPLAVGHGAGGAAAVLQTTNGPVPLAGAADLPALDRFNSGRVVVFSLAAAQHLFARPGGVDVVYVLPAAGASVPSVRAALSAAIGKQDAVLGADTAPPQIQAVLNSFLPLFSLLALFSLGTGAVLVYNTIALSVEERRRQLAIVAAIGGGPGTVAGGLLIESALLGAVGGLGGAAAGIGVAVPIVSSLRGIVASGSGAPLDVHANASVFLIGIVLGTVVGILAAAPPARRALRLDVSAELTMRERREERAPLTLWRRVIVLAVLLVGTLALCLVAARDGALEPWQAAVGPISFGVLAVVALMFGAAIAPLVITGVSAPFRRRRADVRLALDNLTREPRRTGTVVTAIGAAVSVAFITASYAHSARAGITHSVLQNVHGVSVSTVKPGEGGVVESTLSPATLAAIAHAPGVDHLERSNFTLLGTTSGNVFSVEAFDNIWFGDVPVVRGRATPAGVAAGKVLVSTNLARQHHLRPGDRIDLPTPRGIEPLQIEAIWQAGDFGGRNVTMSYDLFTLLYGDQPPTRITAVGKAGVSDATLVRNVRTAASDPALHISTPQQMADGISSAVAKQLSAFWVMQRCLLLVAFVAVLSTLLLVGVQRRRDFGLLAAVGMRPPELARMIFAEAGLVGVVGSVIGAALGTIMFLALLQVTPILVGFRDAFTPDLASMVVGAILATLVAFLAAGWPAWRTARVEVLEALRYE